MPLSRPALFLAALLAPAAALADVYEITYDVVMTPSGSVFGTTTPTPLSVSFTIDTDAGATVVLPAGTGSWNGPTLYGYAAATLGPIDITYGSKHFDNAHISNRIPASGYTAAVWFDAPLAPGASPRTWIMFSDPDADLQFGGASCGFTCSFYDTASATDRNTFGDASGPLDVSVERAVGLDLEVSYLVPGETALFSVSGATPRKTVYFALSGGLSSSFCPPILGGQCLGVWNPQLLGTAKANARGDAWLVVPVPTSVAVGDTVYLQAGMPDGAASEISQVVTRIVEAP